LCSCSCREWLRGDRRAVKGHSCNCCHKFNAICTALSEGIAKVNKLAEAELVYDVHTHTHTTLCTVMFYRQSVSQTSLLLMPFNDYNLLGNFIIVIP
jgi:hypothetical protein